MVSQNSPFDAATFLKTLTLDPGVYMMFDIQGAVIYVGKAKHLKKRLSSYFSSRPKDAKTQALIAHIHRIEVTVTQRESEALLLESNLIKHHRPKYNIVFKDDKSYPYLYLSTQHEFPKIIPIRGKPYTEGLYLGPYPNMAIVKETLHFLQKVFQIRSCDEATFRHRTRPCLMYQIKRCSAPCVQYIDTPSYQSAVLHVQDFLSQRSDRAIQSLIQEMTISAEKLHFEKAARLRDQIASLQKMRSGQSVSTNSSQDTDIFALAHHGSIFCIDILFVRQGQVIGNQSHLCTFKLVEPPEKVLGAFVEHYYLQGLGKEMLPQFVILDRPLKGLDVLSESLNNLYYHAPKWLYAVRSLREGWRSLAAINAQKALETHLQKIEVTSYQLDCLSESLGLIEPLLRMECFDVSHSGGERPVASCVVMTREGLRKKEYRQFNLDDIAESDDYAGIYRAVFRRYQSFQEKAQPLPQVILIDGGKGQLRSAYNALEELGIEDHMQVIALAKGPERKSGVEELFRGIKGEPFWIPYQDPARMVMQRLRDEAHRFAVKTHRGRRDQIRKRSLLEGIKGIGPKKRQILLNHFGGLAGIKEARVEDIAQLQGFSTALATQILDALRYFP